MPTLEDALRLAAEAHKGMTDKGGAPYILHPIRLMMQMADDETRIVALLHDVVEDTPWTLEQLRAAGYSEPVLAALDALTRRKGESYAVFVERAAADPMARRVKLADIEDNMDIRRLDDVGERDLARLRRYQRARRVLLDAE